MTVRRIVKVAYSLSLKNGPLYHARAFGEENGNPGLPSDYTFRTQCYPANSENAFAAMRFAVARLLRENPEYANEPVFSYGRVSNVVLTASPVMGLTGRNWAAGIVIELRKRKGVLNMTYQIGDWTNFGDVSPKHGQLWIRNATVDSNQDFAECVEIIAGADVGLADNQYMITRGSIYMPLEDESRVAAALDCIGKTLSLATWIDKALAFHAYHGMDQDTFGGFEIVQVGKTLDDWTARGTTCENPDTVLHGNSSIMRYLAQNYLES